jgi:hypothetical protein
MVIARTKRPPEGNQPKPSSQFYEDTEIVRETGKVVKGIQTFFKRSIPTSLLYNYPCSKNY